MGTTKVSGAIEVNETMDRFTGTTSATYIDSDGKIIFSFQASVEAERARAGF
ncbi:MAG TPA: hypothetical protein VNN73_14730 [Blastocatellia bacterium]|nr:hypothetical protein [Blastocatellia bacterium]